jgi:4a-hydroxytetrahydrobiopterin dehydratase
MQKLSSDQVISELQDCAGWVLNAKGQIERTFVFQDFKESLSFVGYVGWIAEQQNHHPDILILWNNVRLSVNTHDAGGITHKDFLLAKTVNAAAKN